MMNDLKKSWLYVLSIVIDIQHVFPTYSTIITLILPPDSFNTFTLYLDPTSTHIQIFCDMHFGT